MIVKMGYSPYLSYAVVEVAADTRKRSLHYSGLCGAAYDAVGVVRSATPWV